MTAPASGRRAGNPRPDGRLSPARPVRPAPVGGGPADVGPSLEAARPHPAHPAESAPRDGPGATVECDAPGRARDVGAHDAGQGGVMGGELPARLITKIEPEPNSGCWLWTAGLGTRYGVFWLRDAVVRLSGRPGMMHPPPRVVYEVLIGPVPRAMELDHLCRNRLCVNPAHLQPVPHRENILRGNGYAGRNSRKTHCPRGHEYTAENTIQLGLRAWFPNGGGACG